MQLAFVARAALKEAGEEAGVESPVLHIVPCGSEVVNG